MEIHRKQRVPQVVLWSALLYVVLLVTTVLVWVLDNSGNRSGDHRLLEVMVDGLKVGLGALIGILSQWAQLSFHPQRFAKEEEVAG